MRNIGHLSQPTDIDCGPTCIKMVGDALGKTKAVDIPEIAAACGTNDQVGTTDTMMAKGMAALGVPHTVGRSKDPQELADYLGTGGYIILRTLTHGIKHWIVLYDFDGQQFKAADPWLGSIQYTPEQVVSIWKPRDYFYFEVPSPASHVVEALLGGEDGVEAGEEDFDPKSYAMHAYGEPEMLADDLRQWGWDVTESEDGSWWFRVEVQQHEYNALTFAVEPGRLTRVIIWWNPHYKFDFRLFGTKKMFGRWTRKEYLIQQRRFDTAAEVLNWLKVLGRSGRQL